MAQPSAQSHMKLITLQLLLWHSILWMVQTIPLVSASSVPPPLPLPKSFLLKSLEQVRKIQAKDEVLLEQLRSCLRQLHSGLLLYKGLLQALAGISPELALTLDMLQLDVTNFATTIWQQMENLGVAPAVQPTQNTMPTFASAFQRRAGGVLATSHLQDFLGMAYRALRHFAQP
ncbi:granulocyte colony-stimulating factor isoform X4 [Nannospalax galili]|uniref:granulocyte colony-stimulating factor isoform X4 n=1 Tax=Nannospalax galili TaxID=1026970 RepID=UPI0004ED15AE|nr:granulocyte colony-stimulating factor isoform X4 [Nannospalax galili]